MNVAIGITGHQQLPDDAAWEWVKRTLSRELEAFLQQITAVSSLAIGADQVFASLVHQLGGEIHAVIPFQGYEKAFSDEDVDRYKAILEDASIIEILQTEGTDEDKYYTAGKRVLELSDVLVAVWDGKAAKGKGGTADIVHLAHARKTPMIHLNPIRKSIKYYYYSGGQKHQKGE
jgi:uncharacterized phage-like protein YoqJ